MTVVIEGTVTGRFKQNAVIEVGGFDLSGGGTKVFTNNVGANGGTTTEVSVVCDFTVDNNDLRFEEALNGKAFFVISPILLIGGEFPPTSESVIIRVENVNWARK
jgi:hypothetical protein